MVLRFWYLWTVYKLVEQGNDDAMHWMPNL